MRKGLSRAARVWIIVLSVIAFTGAVFCAVWYTVPVDVLSKLDKYLDKSDEFYFHNKGRKYQIKSDELREIFHDELKDIRWTNTGVSDTDKFGDFLWIRYDNAKNIFDKVIFRVGKVYIGHMVYKGHKDDFELELRQRMLAKAVDVSGKPLD